MQFARETQVEESCGQKKNRGKQEVVGKNKREPEIEKGEASGKRAWSRTLGFCVRKGRRRREKKKRKTRRQGGGTKEEDEAGEKKKKKQRMRKEE